MVLEREQAGRGRHVGKAMVSTQDLAADPAHLDGRLAPWLAAGRTGVMRLCSEILLAWLRIVERRRLSLLARLHLFSPLAMKRSTCMG